MGCAFASAASRGPGCILLRRLPTLRLPHASRLRVLRTFSERRADRSRDDAAPQDAKPVGPDAGRTAAARARRPAAATWRSTGPELDQRFVACPARRCAPSPARRSCRRGRWCSAGARSGSPCAAGARDLAHGGRDLLLGDRVQGRGRLVEDEQPRLAQQRAGDGEALPLAARHPQCRPRRCACPAPVPIAPGAGGRGRRSASSSPRRWRRA